MPSILVASAPSNDVASIPFPGRIIKAGEPDSVIVKTLQHRLNLVGCGPVSENGIYDVTTTKTAVKFFQAKFSDTSGLPLTIDGEVGSLTWGAMFGSDAVPSSATAPSSLIESVISFANTQVGVMEHPAGSNRGPEVDEYLKAVGLNPKAGSFAWCVAFTHFCYLTASRQHNIANPHIKTAGVLAHWNLAAGKPGIKRITSKQAIDNPGLVKPGALFIIDLGSGLGHSGLVIETGNGRMITIEGNTNDNGSRNGIGVFRRNARKINMINKGFIDYSSF